MAKRFFILLLTVVFMVNVCQAETVRSESAKEIMNRLMDNFVLGVYIGSHGCKIPLDKMFRDFAERSINLLIVNWYNFKMLAPKGLCDIAESYDIYLIVQLFYEPRKSFDYHSKKIDEHVSFVNSFVHSDRVIGWSIGDEPENSNKNVPDYEARIIKFGRMLREKDSKRLLYMNHMPGFRMPMYHCGEDVSAVSQFWMIKWPKGIKELYDKTRAEIKRVTGQERFITTGIGAGVSWFTERDCKEYLPGTGIRVKDVANRKPDEDFLEYMLTAYENKTQGFVAFVYDGMFHKAYHPYTLTDKEGNDWKGMWSAYLEGARIIRARQGWPECRIIEPIEGDTAKEKMNVVILSYGRRKKKIEKVICQYSVDGGFSWEDVPVRIVSELSRVVVKLPRFQRGKYLLIRARAYDGREWSMWSVVRLKVRECSVE